MVIDSTDGVLARRLRVRQVLPGFDGRRLDDIIDFHTYTSLPLLLVWRAGVFSGAEALVLLLPLAASAFGFSRADAKTDDGYFLGFPSYWNVVAFYLVLLAPPVWLSGALVVGFVVLTFVPAKYPYPSRPGTVNRLTLVLGIPWALVVTVTLVGIVPDPPAWALASVAYPVYYMVAGWWVTLRGPGGEDRRAEG